MKNKVKDGLIITGVIAACFTVAYLLTLGAGKKKRMVVNKNGELKKEEIPEEV